MHCNRLSQADAVTRDHRHRAVAEAHWHVGNLTGQGGLAEIEVVDDLLPRPGQFRYADHPPQEAVAHNPAQQLGANLNLNDHLRDRLPDQSSKAAARKTE